MTELLGCPNLVAGLAEAADVVVRIRAAAGQWQDVIRYRRGSKDPFRFAVSAQRLCIQAPSSLSNTSATAKALVVAVIPQQETVPSPAAYLAPAS
jgi:hypothetical protein